MVPTSYGDTFVRITGPAGAPPLVLLPGAATTSLMWAPNVQALSESFRTIALDQLGEVGRTTCFRPVRRYSDLLAWLNELFEALKLGAEINLAGLSYGGALAAQYTLHFPERLRSTILLAPGATVLRTSAKFMASLILTAISRGQCLPRIMRWIFSDMARKDPKWIETAIEQLVIGSRSLQPRLLPFPPVLTDAEWAGIKVPTLFLVGEHETIYDPVKAVRRLNRVAPQIKTEMIPGAGHDLTFVQAEMVNLMMVEFLQQNVAAPLRASQAGQPA